MSTDEPSAMDGNRSPLLPTDCLPHRRAPLQVKKRVAP
jgi:hypothetical protein